MLTYLLLLCASLYLVYRAIILFISRYDQVDLANSRLGEDCPQKRFNRAVVIGGSISGLVACAVLSKHSDKVILIERLKYQPSKSVAKQADQVHVILERGLTIWERLFPGLCEEMKAAGALELFWGQDINWWSVGGKKRSFDKGLFGSTLVSMRSLYEPIIRNRVLSLPNVEVLQETAVTGFVVNSENQVLGVNAKCGGVEKQIGGDLIVDCCGMSSMSPIWLKKLGMPVPFTEVKVDLAYSSVILKFERELPPAMHYIQPFPPSLKGSSALSISKHEKLLTCFSVNKLPYPKTVEEMKTFCNGTPFISEFLQEGSPVTDVKRFKKESNIYRYYEKLDLDGLVVMGDALCSFNPVYGGGQSTASEAALLLDTIIRETEASEPTKSLCKAFQTRLSRLMTIPWLLATSTDLEYPLSSGGTFGTRLVYPILHKIIERVHRLSVVNTSTYLWLLSMVHMRQGYVWLLFSRQLWGELLLQRTQEK